MLESFGARSRPSTSYYCSDKTGGERCESMRAYVFPYLSSSFQCLVSTGFQMSLSSLQNTPQSIHSRFIPSRKKKGSTKLNSETDSTIEDSALVLGQGAS
ncbi:hypothetical protein NC653_034072 [Populus alba x Populus x berolinensis]|uniref:Uncharacterized protein n=1 Tax=Populus alba x Populus x berolinensis TaxID=444605 RepID=A0AAD6LLP2_9ROSI|nr:hypothetical protein NC653_034072 [Populus alba x Populus x berolinensis]